MTFACCVCFSLHLRSALDILLLALLMVLSGYLMFVLLIGKYSSTSVNGSRYRVYVVCALSIVPLPLPSLPT
jgi:hypothetical protein